MFIIGVKIVRIAYLVNSPPSKFDGVNRKILNTVKKWNSMGEEAKLFLFVKKEYVPPKELINNPYVEFIKYKNKLSFFLNDDLVDSLRNWKPDVLYIRGIITNYSFPLKKLKRQQVSIQEINTNDIEEYKYILLDSIKRMNFKKMMMASYYLLTRKKSLVNNDGYIILNNQLANIIPRNSTYEVVGDAINLSEYPIWKNKSNYKRDDLNVVFMGTDSHPWYGIDKIVYLANKLANVNFHIIGLNEKDIKIYKPVNDNIFCYGFLRKKEYEKLLEKMDVALGSLSMHVNKMSEGSPLKGREYLAYGLPTIIGYKDTDFYNNCPKFILEIPSEKDNVIEYLDQIYEFIKNSKEMKIDREDIKHLDYQVKEQRRLDFIQSLFLKNITSEKRKNIEI